MATSETYGVMGYVDEQGNTNIHYPITKAELATYDNAASGLPASNVQEAVDELAEKPSGIYYGTCDTAATTVAKVVTCPDFSALKAGACVRVKFANANSAGSSPTINVNNTGAVSIRCVGTSYATSGEWEAGEVLDFVYDGTYWMIVDGGVQPIIRGGTGATTAAAARSNLGAAEVRAGTNSLSTSGWYTGSGTSLYYQTISISGVTDFDVAHVAPIIDTTDTDAGDAIREAWNQIYTAETVSGGIKFYAEEIPSVRIPFSWEVVR